MSALQDAYDIVVNYTATDHGVTVVLGAVTQVLYRKLRRRKLKTIFSVCFLAPLLDSNAPNVMFS